MACAWIASQAFFNNKRLCGFEAIPDSRQAQRCVPGSIGFAMPLQENRLRRRAVCIICVVCFAYEVPIQFHAFC